LGRGAPAPDPAMLCALLQRNQNPSGAEQGCAVLSRRSASWNHQITRNPRRTSSPTRPDLVFATHNHMRKQTAARRSLLKELSALTHLLFLPSLIAPLVKESGAVSAAHIGSREAFNALMAV